LDEPIGAFDSKIENERDSRKYFLEFEFNPGRQNGQLAGHLNLNTFFSRKWEMSSRWLDYEVEESDSLQTIAIKVTYCTKAILSI